MVFDVIGIGPRGLEGYALRSEFEPLVQNGPHGAKLRGKVAALEAMMPLAGDPFLGFVLAVERPCEKPSKASIGLVGQLGSPLASDEEDATLTVAALLPGSHSRV